MFNFMHMLEHLHPGITDFVKAGMVEIFTREEVHDWLLSMAAIGVREIKWYTVVDQPYCSMSDLMELDNFLAERRQFAGDTYTDMHLHYEAAFMFVNAGRASGLRYTLADYGRQLNGTRKAYDTMDIRFL